MIAALHMGNFMWQFHALGLHQKSNLQSEESMEMLGTLPAMLSLRRCSGTFAVNRYVFQNAYLLPN